MLLNTLIFDVVNFKRKKEKERRKNHYTIEYKTL